MPNQNKIQTSLVNAKDDTKAIVIELNNPSKRNALDLEMVDELSAVLKTVAQDASLGLVILKSTDAKAFCAGGDVRKIYDWAKAHKDGATASNDNYADDFFEREYRLDYIIHKYPKPVLCWAEGMTMGGGLGLFRAASHRVATESTKLAMPEVTIGLFPDAGGTEFMASVEEPYGLFLGLTGAVIQGADAVYYSIANCCIAGNKYNNLLDDIKNTAWSGSTAELGNELDDLLSSYDNGPIAPFEMTENMNIIESLKGLTSYQEVMDAMLGFEGTATGDWMSRAMATFRSGCPLTMAIVVEQLKRARTLNLGERFRMEMNVAAHCVRGSEFIEGVRALLVDKDRKPKWRYPDAGSVPNGVVQEHFESMWSKHPLADLGCSA